MSKLARSLADQIRTQAAISARPGQAVVLERIADQVAELEAAQRPPLGYAVLSKRGETYSAVVPARVSNLARAELMRERLAGDIDKHPDVWGGSEFVVAELREVQS